jgi:D-arginine dehydrogenase
VVRAVVVGGGMAGVSVAAELARRGADVVLLEAEAELAHHTTGRSAAMYLPTYGTPLVRALTVASRGELDALAGDVGSPLLSPRRLLYVADADGEASRAELVASGSGLRPLTAGAVLEHCPALRADVVVAAAIDDDGADLDVAGLHQAYVRRLRAAGGEIARGEPVLAVDRSTSGWEVRTPTRTLGCDVVVDAAGAWADEVAVLAGALPVGLRPLRRTLFTCPPGAHDVRGWPLVADAAWRFYLKPEGDLLLVSPADETPSPPCDARPEELDVARAIEAVNATTTLGLRSVRSSWAGLRTFAPDGDPVAGCRPDERGFAWSAGQGGYGIQMAPALAIAAAALAIGDPLPADLTAHGVSEPALSPARFSPPDPRRGPSR